MYFAQRDFRFTPVESMSDCAKNGANPPGSKLRQAIAPVVLQRRYRL
jgi:hypothetical protein